VLLEVIADKTGYPEEMLELDMMLDTDLGIDSIKRVEILSALQERLPEAPIVKPEHLGTLHNLRQIAVFLANGHAAPVPEAIVTKVRPEAPAAPGAVQALERSVLRLVPSTVSAPASRTAGATIWLTNDDPVLSGALRRILEERGHVPLPLACAALRTQPFPPALDGLIVLAPPAAISADFLKDALFGLQHLGPALRESRAFFATVSRLDGGFGLLDLDPARAPVDGGLAGLCKTAAHEWPEVRCQMLDIGPHVTAAALADALLAGETGEVGISHVGIQRLERVVQSLPPASRNEPLRAGDVVLVTGGARGVTAEAAVALAAAFAPTLILLGRSSAPEPEPAWLAPLLGEAEIKRELASRMPGTAPRLLGERTRQVLAQREIEKTLERIAGAGGQAHYRCLDLRDKAGVAAMLQEVRASFGAIRGLIHGAGVLADALIEDKTAEQFERVYGTKVEGLRSLLAGLPADELRVLALFSSSTARFGRKGQVDYAIANEVLNKIAQQQRRLRPACKVVAVNWGPWDGGMVTPGLRQLFAQEGIPLIPTAAGADFLIRELCGPLEEDTEVVVLGGSLPRPTPAAPPIHAPPSPGPALPIAFERVLDLTEHPVLESHVLDGHPVLPLALMLEWLGHGALHENPGLQFHGCDNLRVLHGVILDEGLPPVLRIGAAKASKRDGLLIAPVEMRSIGADGREVLHARGEIVLASELPAAPTPLTAPSVSAYAHGRDKIYRSLLFHGPDLHGIDRVEGCSEAGIIASVRTAVSPGAWFLQPMRHKWLSDPLALDSSFQLLILWSLERHQAGNLPVGVGRYRQYRRAFPADGVRVVARVTRHTDLHALADIDFLDGAGLVVARLEDYECALNPALQRAFRRNRLPEPAVP
jgi:NAD(P)-dependent dehydrogenase (short-subunit alcohol dehydrogenase family)